MTEAKIVKILDCQFGHFRFVASAAWNSRLAEAIPGDVYSGNAGANDLLTGNLTFNSIAQTAMGGGVFNDQLVINFTVTGGDLSSAFLTNNGIVQLTIKFTTTQSLATIMSNQTLLAKVVSGAVFPVPEPTSLSLLSFGLLGLAGLCKKKIVTLRT